MLLGRNQTDTTAAKNTILGTEYKNQAAASTSTATQQGESTCVVAGRKVIVVDTPDLFSCEMSREKFRQPIGPQAFLLVIPVKYSEDKMLSENKTQDTLLKMEELFGERCWRNTMILFTASDGLQNKTIEEYIQAGDLELQKLVDKCGSRFHCLSINESEDDSQVLELLEKIEKMVEGNRNGTEIYQIISDMEAHDVWRRRVQYEMQETLEKCDQYIKDFESDLKSLEKNEISLEHTEMISKMKQEHVLKKDIGEHVKMMYDRVAGLEENRHFIKAILPQNQQTIWLSLPEQSKIHDKHNELRQLEECFSKAMGNLYHNKKKK